ncbi:GTP-binding protein 1 [Strongylocentrotus purpuratus]|uniref:GTP-binding protein 1 n=1 Tax=Strongylocentrotus purpuratus TaxID=7668 RepID=A0A7M7TGE0_STRPU|nr:GTP-binding protein 1 [Strongylocentrotus purpuratus]|eukprot:XP_782266.4 PREDICTED: GTP-binding protein 1 [Strongylocentrotus purpuratus]
MAAIVTNFLPDSPSQDNLKSPTTPTTPSAPFPGMGECNLFSPEDTLNGDDALIGELNAKDKLVCPSDMVYDAILKQLHERLEEGQGETIYSVGQGGDGKKSGLSPDEVAASAATLERMAQSIEADVVLLRERDLENGTVADYLVRRRADEEDFYEVRVAVVGNVDAGKSTLLGVLTHGELDNGRGFARQKLFRHKHEMESGRTSSVGNDILGFDSKGEVVNKPDSHGGSLDWVRICENSSKVITFIDLAGHEKYLKTTVFGMTGHAPDFGMLMVGSNAGVIGMTKEHLGLALALSVPVFVVVTKIDMCPPNVLQETLKLLQRILKSPGCRKIPVLVNSKEDVVMMATNFSSERVCPIFQVSNVTGENLSLLKMFLNLLTTRTMFDENEPAEFQIDETYSVPGVGTVVSGTTLKGTVRINDILALGPDSHGHFQQVIIKSIHRKRMPVKMVRGGQTASFALKKQIKRSQVRKGMVMVSPEINPVACWEFEGEILVLHHPTTISTRYQAMVHVGSTRQTASIINMSVDHMRTGDKATVRFRFIKNPEYLKADCRMVFREGRTKAVGKITKILPHAPATENKQKLKVGKGRGHHTQGPKPPDYSASGGGRGTGRRGRHRARGPGDVGATPSTVVVGTQSSQTTLVGAS